ncbi:glyoxylase-like metal-dependent hydrolase (beta-lactamase superfamily II) [Bacillus sp. 3255]|nr:glyoxylase-like metal-dependent hydrolase (beta-lactamase superfamily II) [Bacillus sp. 3255]
MQLLWGAEQPMSALLLALFARHGFPEVGLAEMTKHMESFVELVSPQPQVTLLREGPVRLGDRVYEAIETPGHAAGHLVFYDAEAEVMFCGDHVLPQISPNVSFLPQVEENPLGAYLTSLQEIGRLKVRMAYPGHREPWQGFNARTEELVRHHHERLALMEGQLSAPLSAYEVCRATFGDRLSIHQMRFALSETIAHLILLEAEGRIRAADPAAELIQYVAAGRSS